MKSIRGKTAVWLLATACTAAMALGAVQDDTAVQVPTMTDARGDQILNQSCSSCHELRSIETQALDKDGWSKEVATMVEKGSSIKAEDVPGFVDYLVRKHGPLPDGAGKQVMLNVCTMCHDLERIRKQPSTRDEWEATLQAMLNEGAPLSDDDFPVILTYLSRNFGRKE
jgi:cytochrome c5